MEHGGEALINGVRFHSDTVVVKATKEKNKIVVVDDVDHEEYDYVDRDRFDLDVVLSRIPFVRGWWNYLEGIVKWKIIVIAISIIIIALEFIDNLWIQRIEVWAYVFFTILIVGAVLLFRFTAIATKYHAAEHMVSNCAIQGLDLTFENVRKQSRIHTDCGTNLFTFALISFLVLSLIPGVQEFHFFLKLCLSWSIGYELFLMKHTYIKPIYLIGYGMQYAIFTSKPNKEHLKVAILAFKRLQKRQGEIDNR